MSAAPELTAEALEGPAPALVQPGTAGAGHAPRRRRLHRRARASRHGWVAQLALLDLAVVFSSLWVSRVAVALLLVLLPGRLALQAARVPAATIRRFPPYLVCAGLAVLVTTTLGVDLVGPLLGDPQPLRPLPLLVGIDVVVVLLGLVAGAAPAGCRLGRGDLLGRPALLWPLVLPLASIAATARLDNGRGGTLSLAVLAAVAALIAASTLLAARMSCQHLSAVVYASGLATMLLTSTRSAYVVGYDISKEYFDLHETVLAGVWHPGHLDPYSAMLSLTVLPASLHALIAGQDVWIFKVLYPALFATFPVAVFWIVSWVLSRRVAFVAAAVLLSQYYFFEQQPEIARQELALVVFAGLVAALLDRSLGDRRRVPVVVLLAATLVVCHYSTTYVAIGICLAAAACGAVLTRRPRPAALWPFLLAAATMLVGAAVWYVPVTHSTSNLTFLVDTVRRQGIALLPGRRPGQSIISAYFNAIREPPAGIAQFQRDVAGAYRRYYPYIVPIPGAGAPNYALRPAPSFSVPGRLPWLARPLNDAALLIQQGLNLLGTLGAVVLALRRRTPPALRAAGWAGAGAVVMLASSRLSGTLAADYNSSRLWLQCFFLLALAAAAAIDLIAVERRPAPSLRQAALCALGLVLAVAFVENSGLVAPLEGGSPSLLVSNKSEDYSRLYVTAPEEATVRWLASALPRTSVLYADNYGVLSLNQFFGRVNGVFNVITPETLDRHAWVYATAANVVGHRTWGESTSGVVEFRFPARFLADRFDLVFSTGTTEVFHR